MATRVSFSTQTTTPILLKITDFGLQISVENMTKCDRDIHPLLLESFPTFLGCIQMTGRASDSISDPLMVNTVSFSLKITLKFQSKLPILGSGAAWEM